MSAGSDGPDALALTLLLGLGVRGRLRFGGALTGEQFRFEAPDEGYPIGPYQLHIRRLAADATVLIGITSTAPSGAPEHATLASAHTGQVITLTGSGLRIGEQVICSRSRGHVDKYGQTLT